MKGRFLFFLSLILALGPISAVRAQNLLLLGSTTTLENSGFLQHLIPYFTDDTGIRVRTIIAGTGRVLEAARRGDVDATFTHDPIGEERLVSQRVLVRYQHVMRNHFLIAGPKRDPANIAEAENAPDAFKRIAERRSLFVSRGDDSGTHRMELRVWGEVREEPPSSRINPWYRETGSGMGATANIAAALNGYMLVDEATWAKFANRRNLKVLVRDNDRLLNIYSVAMVNPRVNPNLRRGAARQWIRWITSPAGRRAIRAFRINDETVFTLMGEEAAAE